MCYGLFRAKAVTFCALFECPFGGCRGIYWRFLAICASVCCKSSPEPVRWGFLHISPFCKLKPRAWENASMSTIFDAPILSSSTPTATVLFPSLEPNPFDPSRLESFHMRCRFWVLIQAFRQADRLVHAYKHDCHVLTRKASLKDRASKTVRALLSYLLLAMVLKDGK